MADRDSLNFKNDTSTPPAEIIECFRRLEKWANISPQTLDWPLSLFTPWVKESFKMGGSEEYRIGYVFW